MPTAGWCSTRSPPRAARHRSAPSPAMRSEEHTSELQSRLHLVCRLLLEKKKKPHHTLCLDPARLHGAPFHYGLRVGVHLSRVRSGSHSATPHSSWLAGVFASHASRVPSH